MELDSKDILHRVQTVREFFASGATRPLEWRRQQIQAIKNMIVENNERFAQALKADLGVNDFWTQAVELSTIQSEATLAMEKLKDWTKAEKVPTPIVSMPGSSYIEYEPYGTVLIIGPWNYPLSLLLNPLIAAIAAGNTAVLKPSEVSINSSKLLAELLPSYVSKEAVAVVQGAVPETTLLLKEKWDLIMYTGNGMVAKIVMRAAAEHLTPVILELGGKSPVIVAPDANLDRVAKRICWGKWTLNNGQTCIAPDYVLVTEKNRQQLVDKLKATLHEFYGNPETSADVSRMINERHTQRVAALLDDPNIKVVHGGEVNVEKKYISPTIVECGGDSKVMSEEIFGPVLPVLTVKDVDEAVKFVNARDKPLALYVFSESSKVSDKVIASTSSGAVNVNDCAMHAANNDLPFGGVGAAGMGAYHGVHGFKAFSHAKPVFVKYGSDPSLRFPPYTQSKLKWLARLRSFGLGSLRLPMFIILVGIALGLAYKYNAFN